MPHVRSFSGLYMVAKYVKNWYSLLILYSNIISKTTAKFKDGMKIVVTSDNYLPFYSELYKRHLQANGFVYETTKEKATIVHTSNGLQVKILDPLYSFVLDEIFLMKIYGGPNLKGRTAIDIGVSVGDSALYFASMGASKVFGFEPSMELFKLAQENIELNNMIDKIQIYNERATSESLKSLISHYGLKDLFLKIDCEGCEHEIIENTDFHIFEKITDIVMEYHQDPERLMKRLARLGFKAIRKKEIILAVRN